MNLNRIEMSFIHLNHHLHPGLGLPQVPGGVGEEGWVGVVGGHGVRHRGEGGVVLTGGWRPVGRAVTRLAGVGAGEGRGWRQGVIVVGGGGHTVGVRVVCVLSANIICITLY